MDLFSILLFAAMFYLMMRFGCGAHMRHGGHRHEGHHEGHGAGGGRSSDTSKDPVCGMPVAPGEGYSEIVNGRELRFCSRQCLEKFEAQSQRRAA